MTTDRPQRPPWNGLIVPIVSSRPGAWLFSRTMHVVDRPLLRLTKGRVSFASGYPVMLLTTTGARSGRPRTVPVLYVQWGEGVAIIGTRFGNKRHPGWYHNLCAHPEAVMEIKGVRRTCTAREAREDERDKIWARAVRNYSGYDRYAARAGRKIPIMVLAPTQEG